MCSQGSQDGWLVNIGFSDLLVVGLGLSLQVRFVIRLSLFRVYLFYFPTSELKSVAKFVCIHYLLKLFETEPHSLLRSIISSLQLLHKLT